MLARVYWEQSVIEGENLFKHLGSFFGSQSTHRGRSPKKTLLWIQSPDWDYYYFFFFNGRKKRTCLTHHPLIVTFVFGTALPSRITPSRSLRPTNMAWVTVKDLIFPSKLTWYNPMDGFRCLRNWHKSCTILLTISHCYSVKNN
jgi:hypothetical protein